MVDTCDETAVREIIRNWCKGLEEKNVDKIMADYAEDALIYDAIPPYKTEGAQALKAIWESCIDCFPKQFEVEIRDLKVSVSTDLSFASYFYQQCGWTISKGWLLTR